MSILTPKQKFIMALEGQQPPGLVPHFELRMFLTMEIFGKVHPEHRSYHQWSQMEEKERQLHRRDIARLNIYQVSGLGQPQFMKLFES